MIAPQTRTLVALATYNERDNLVRLVQEIRRTVPEVDVLIVDDHSPDGTGDLANALAAQDAKIHVIHRPAKLGLGTAILEIIQHALKQNYEYLVTMDADFSHHPRYLPDLLRGMNDADIMIGSRYVAGSGLENWPLSRRLMSRSTSRLVRLLLNLPIQDSSTNYRCYRTSLLRRANLENLLSHGYSFLQEVLHRCHLAGARFGEIPINFVERLAGRSKANLPEMVQSLTMLFRLGWLARFHKSSIMPRIQPSDASAPITRRAA